MVKRSACDGGASSVNAANKISAHKHGCLGAFIFGLLGDFELDANLTGDEVKCQSREVRNNTDRRAYFPQHAMRRRQRQNERVG
jgi:hypothetical protein